tara:strand:+ start:492 stop:3209 length:2718 start_codon:yes stop_codon:yes gene_type:complete
MIKAILIFFLLGSTAIAESSKTWKEIQDMKPNIYNLRNNLKKYKLKEVFKNSPLGKLSKDEQDMFMKIMIRESKGYADAEGDKYKIYTKKNGRRAYDTSKPVPPVKHSYGLFQIRGVNLPFLKTKMKIDNFEELKDPAKNMEAAYHLYVANGFQPWGNKMGGSVYKRSATPAYRKQYSLLPGTAYHDLAKKHGLLQVDEKETIRKYGKFSAPVSKPSKPSKPSKQFKDNLEDPTVIPRDKSKVQSWMKKHGYTAKDLEKPGSLPGEKPKYYHPGDRIFDVSTDKQEVKKPEQNIEVEDIELEETIPVDQSVPYGVYAGGEPEYYQSEQDQFWTGAEGGEVKKYDNGGEVVDEYEDSWMRSNDEEVIDEYDDSWMRDYLIESTPEYIKSPEYQEGVATVPGIPGFVPQPEPKIETEEIDVKSVVKKYVEGGKTYEDRKQIIALISDGKTTREEVSSLIKQFDRPEPEDMVAQGGRDPRTPPGPMMREALGLGKEPTKEPRGASGTWEEDKVVKDTTTQAAPGKNLRKLTKKEFLDIRQLQDEKKLREAEDAAVAQAMKAATIDPNRFYKNQSTFNKIVSLVGLAAGAYGASKYGTPNVFIKRLDDAVKKDIEAQKLGQTEEGKKLAAANFKVAVLARRLARSTKEIDKRNTLERLSLSYQKKGEKAAKKLAQKDYNQLLLEAVNTRGLTDKELSIISVNLPKMKIEQSVIKGRDGLNYYVKGGVSRANKVKEYVANAQQTIDGLNDLIGYVDKVSFLEQGTFNPFGALFSQDRAEAESLRDRLVGNLRIEFFGPGVMTDQEREQAKKILGDPNRLFTTDEREIAKIRNLMMKVNYGVRQKLRSDGVALPVSPNERRIAQMLKRRNLSNVPVNRRKVVDQLIFQEKEHVEKGGTPGKWWDPSEPLAV